MYEPTRDDAPPGQGPLVDQARHLARKLKWPSLVGSRFTSLPVDPMPDWARPLASKVIERAIL